MLIVKRVWELLDRDSLLPESGCRKHLLWALHFMKVYPKQSPGCSAVGASAGTVSQKTHRKPQVGLGVYRRRRQPGHCCGKYLQCEDRCGNVFPKRESRIKGNTFASHKYTGKFALRYELGVNILAGNLVWTRLRITRVTG